jgi:hypothetical protein
MSITSNTSGSVLGITGDGGTLGTAAYTAASAYATAAKGVTNGDTHNHFGGDGGQIDHGSLYGLADDDHPQYTKHSLATATSDFLVASGAGAFVKKTLAQTQTILGITGAFTPYNYNSSRSTSFSSAEDIFIVSAYQVSTNGTYTITANVFGYAEGGAAYIGCGLRKGVTTTYNNGTQLAYGAQSSYPYGTVSISTIVVLTTTDYILMGQIASGVTGTRSIYGDDVVVGGTQLNFHRIA